jgi:ABC-2 type transport system ATP-binding protein
VAEIEQLRALHSTELEVDFAGPPPDLGAVEGVVGVEPTPEGLRLRLSGSPRPVLVALAAADVVAVRTREASLEEIFLAYYGEPDGPSGGSGDGPG